MQESPILGIDLGTTTARMAWVDSEGVARLVPNAEGSPSTPSVVHLLADGTSLVGEPAVAMAVRDPGHTVGSLRLHLGDRAFAPELHGRAWSAEELQALILHKLKVDAERALGTEIRDLVLTVPSRFDSVRRGATAEAGAIAGFDVLSIINESHAVVYSVGDLRSFERPLGEAPRTLLVLVLDGAGLEIDVLEDGTRLRTLAHGGRADLEDTDVLSLCRETTERVLGTAGVPWEKLHEVLLVGASPWMHPIRRWVTTRAGRAPHGGVDPDAAVALGAARCGVIRHRPGHPALRD